MLKDSTAQFGPKNDLFWALLFYNYFVPFEMQKNVTNK